MRVGESSALEDLIRLIVERCSERSHHGETTYTDSQAEEVMLDIDVDGDRYLIVRLPKPRQRGVQLSPREQEIVRLVALGHSNKIIADVLSISSWTVCTHLRRIFSKLGVGSRAAMVARFHVANHGHSGMDGSAPKKAADTTAMAEDDSARNETDNAIEQGSERAVRCLR